MLITHAIALFPLPPLRQLHEQQHTFPTPDVSVPFFFSFSVFFHAFVGSKDIEILCAQESV